MDKQGNEYCLRLCFGADGYTVVDACWKDILPENSNIDRIEQLSQDAAGAFETMDSYCIDGACRVEFVHFDDLDFVFAYCLAGWIKVLFVMIIAAILMIYLIVVLAMILFLSMLQMIL